MAKNLVIVESPAKEKTIAKYLGADFEVRSSYGHIRDLPKKGLAIDLEHNFEPQYTVSADKEDVVKALQTKAKKMDLVWLATDEDREGEAISWHLFEVLNVPEENIRRITFNEITEKAIQKAIQNPRKIDYNLVNAQQARRVLDRLVGFELSPVLWKKVKMGLSAGRVQSVTVRLVVEREREIQQFQAKEYYKITGAFEAQNIIFKAELQLSESKIKTSKQVLAVLEALKNPHFILKNKEIKPATKNPSAPFTTSTLQQEASRKLGFSPAQTMSVAQKLYEKGWITYMRTDALHLSEQALEGAKNAIEGFYGKDFHQRKQYTTKSKGAQEAHEAIRPTDFQLQQISGENGEKKLYELIWKRTIASQMAPAQFERTKMWLEDQNSSEKYTFLAVGEVLQFEGFMKVYLESLEEETEEDGDNNDGRLPKLKENEAVICKNIQAQQKFTHHPARYTEAALIKKLEELGIGRPSTYAPTLSTIQKREYVLREDRVGKIEKRITYFLEKGQIAEHIKEQEVGAEKKKLFPTDMGLLVNDFLMDHFAQIMNYDFTAQVEKEFDQIAEGNLAWQKMIGNFYQPFHQEVSKTIETSDRVKKDRLLGQDPKTGHPIYAKIARFGPILQIGDTESVEKPIYIPLEKSQSIQTISLEEALQMINSPRLPRHLGMYKDQEVIIGKGRFGPYIKYGDRFISLKSKLPEDEPMAICLERATVLLEEALDPNKGVVRVFNEDFKILEGRYGIYIKKDGENYKIPKEFKDKIQEVAQETILSWVEVQKNDPKKKPTKKIVAKKTETKKTAAKKTTVKTKTNKEK